HEQIAIEGIVTVACETAALGIDLPEPVDRLQLDACRFRHALGSPNTGWVQRPAHNISVGSSRPLSACRAAAGSTAALMVVWVITVGKAGARGRRRPPAGRIRHGRPRGRSLR